MAAAAKRSWGNFNLRTMFIVITLLCVLLGWQGNHVRQRKAMLKEFTAKHFVEVTTASSYAARFQGAPPPERVATVFFLRNWLGDEAIQEIGYYPHIVGAAKLAEMRGWFPEAKFVESRPMEPCHPGCFPWGTLIETAQGQRPIEQIQVGDAIIAVDRDGEIQRIKVSSIFRTRNQLLELHTSAGILLTTRTQPLCVTSSKNIAAGELERGDRILIWKSGAAAPATVKQVVLSDRIEPVINLVLRDSEAFIANGFLARSKPPAESPLANSHARAH
jgi:hypothetical protein